MATLQPGDKATLLFNGQPYNVEIATTTVSAGSTRHSVRLEEAHGGLAAGTVLEEVYSNVRPHIAHRYGIKNDVVPRAS